MNAEKILEVISIYRSYFTKEGIGIIDFPHNGKPSSKEEISAHCHGMLDKIEGFVKEGRTEKAKRWLGFIQGCLWSTGQYPLEDLMNHNKPKTCTVCGKSVGELTEETVPIFIIDAKIGEKEVKNWNSRISSCNSCLEKLGKPLRVIHQPYERDLAEFEKAKELVVLVGSGSSKD